MKNKKLLDIQVGLEDSLDFIFPNLNTQTFFRQVKMN